MMSKITRRSTVKAMIVAGIGASALFSMIPVANAAATVNLRVSSSLSSDMNSSHYVWFDRFQSNLKATTNGAVNVTYFANNMLGKESDIVQQVRLGAVDMMVSGTSIWSTLAPEIGVLDLGYLFVDNAHAGRALDGKAGEILTEMLLKKANVKALGYGFSLGARNVYTKHLLKTPEDLHGVKTRVLPVPNFVATLKAMGAAAVPMPFGEIYSGLQMGVIDGIEQDAPTVLAGKFYEVAKFCTLTQHIYNPIVATINKNSFDRIPPELQALVVKAAAEATQYERKQAAETETRAFAELKKLGVTVTPTDREYFAKAVKPVWADFAKQYPAIQPVLDAVESVRK